MPYGMTQCYLPLCRSDIPAFAPINLSWYLICQAGEMQG